MINNMDKWTWKMGIKSVENLCETRPSNTSLRYRGVIENI